MLDTLLGISEISGRLVAALSGTMKGWYPVFYNGIGVLAILLQFLTFQMESRKKILFWATLSKFGWLSYFVFQGDFISGLPNIIAVMSNIVFGYRGKYRWAESRWWLVFFLVFTGASSLLTFQTWKDIFPLGACLLSLVSFFMIDENKLRKLSFITLCVFLCNSTSKGYIVSFIADITGLLSIILAMIRYKKKANEKVKQTPASETELASEATINAE